MTSHPKDSTPVRDTLLGNTLDRPHTMAVTCVRRPFKYSTKGAQPMAHRHMSTSWCSLAAHDLPSQRFDPSPRHFPVERTRQAPHHTMAVTCVRRPFKYSTKGAQPMAHRHMSTSWCSLAAHDLPSQRFDPSPRHFPVERTRQAPHHTMAVTCVRRPFKYSTEGAQPLAYRHMSTTWA